MPALCTPVRRPRDEKNKRFPDHQETIVGGAGVGRWWGLFMDDFAVIYRLGYDLQLHKENLMCDSTCP